MPIPFTVDASSITSLVATTSVHLILSTSSMPSPATAMSAATATASAIAAAVTSAAVTSDGKSPEGPGAGGPGGGGGEGECSLLGSFALLVQLALGGLALLSLVYKRWRERPQRPLKIWFFDVSKQVFGSVLVHIANIFMSMLTSGRFSMQASPSTVQTAARLFRRDVPYVPNPCSFYLLNLAIDTTIGIPILIVLLRVITGLIAYTPFGKPRESIQSGHYGSPPNAWWWLKQSVIYFCGLFGMKICVLLIFLILPWISRVGDWALGWTEGNERLQIVFVMMLFPLIMNALQYYIIDSFIKKKETDHELIPQEDASERDPFGDSFGDDSDDESASDDSHDSVQMSRSAKLKGSLTTSGKNGHEEYDPDLDGQTVVGSSKSQEERGKVLPRELVPPE
ncbi:vacuolar membrane protein-domain-containing protein [Nemania sp. FL0916]|nr:vacuolar membrane protein-domain-containing protein [Nemania sp. FL0916]